MNDAAETVPTVVIDCRAAVREQIGGVERYAIEVSARLRALRPDRYRLLAPRRRLRHRAGHVWEQAVLPLRARGSQLVYCPANLAPLVGPPRLVVIHDVAALSQPAAYGRGYTAYQAALLPAIARTAQRIITVSEFSRAEIAERLRLDVERIAVVPGGVSERFSPQADVGSARSAHRLPSRYVLAVGTASARKNHGMLEALAAALRHQGDGGDHHTAVVLAGSDRAYLRTDADPAPATIRRLGYVPDEYLPGLYAGARALVMPSLHEGFGLPCLEAMASGTPVIAAATAALPETCGDAALLVDPRNPQAFVEAVRSALEDAGLRDRLIASGLRRAGAFTWQQTAERTDAQVSDLLGYDR